MTLSQIQAELSALPAPAAPRAVVATAWGYLHDCWFCYPAGHVLSSTILGYVQSVQHGGDYRREAKIRVPGTRDRPGAYDVLLGSFSSLDEARSAVSDFLATHGRVDPSKLAQAEADALAAQVIAMAGRIGTIV